MLRIASKLWRVAVPIGSVSVTLYNQVDKPTASRFMGFFLTLVALPKDPEVKLH
jgi:hypothetical protein